MNPDTSILTFTGKNPGQFQSQPVWLRAATGCSCQSLTGRQQHLACMNILGYRQTISDMNTSATLEQVKVGRHGTDDN